MLSYAEPALLREYRFLLIPSILPLSVSLEYKSDSNFRLILVPVNSQMKKQLLVLLFFCLPVLIMAQKRKPLKYKEVFEIVKQGNETASFEALKDFQEQNPQSHINVYFQLGILCHKWMRDYDPLKDINDVEHFSEQAKVYLGICKARMNKDEVEDNVDYYPAVKRRNGSTLELEDVMLDLDNRIADIENFRATHTQMVKHFNEMLTKYNSCIDQFMALNQKNANIKDLYLTANTSFFEKINTLKSTYESMLASYKQYNEVVNGYSISDYNQVLVIKDIQTYRLNGLTSSDFLKNEVPVWNFGKWVDDFHQKIQQEINPLRSEIEEAGNQLDASIAFFNGKNSFSNEWQAYKVPNATLFKIGKYDYQSAIVYLFQYQESKAKLLQLSKREENNPNRPYSEAQRSQYYVNLIRQYNATNALLEEAKDNIKAFAFDKHTAYLKKHYSDFAGLQRFLQTEKAANTTLLQNTIKRFKPVLLASISDVLGSNKDTVLYRRQPVTAYVNTQAISWDMLKFDQFDTAQTNQYYTTNLSQGVAPNYWISGYQKRLGKLPTPFVARMHDLDSLQELKKMVLFPHRDTVGQVSLMVKAGEQNAFMLKTALHDTLLHTLVKLDTFARVQQIDTVKAPGLPQLIKFDELNDLMLMAFYGGPEGYRYNQFQPLTIQLRNSSGTVYWQRSLSLKGELVDVVRFGDYWALVGNYKSIADETGKILNASPSQTSGFVAFFKTDGTYHKLTTFQQSTGLTLFKAIKTNSNTLNVLGLKKGNIAQKRVNQSRVPLYFALINRKGELIYQNDQE